MSNLAQLAFILAVAVILQLNPAPTDNSLNSETVHPAWVPLSQMAVWRGPKSPPDMAGNDRKHGIPKSLVGVGRLRQDVAGDDRPWTALDGPGWWEAGKKENQEPIQMHLDFLSTNRMTPMRRLNDKNPLVRAWTVPLNFPTTLDLKCLHLAGEQSKIN
jgi:hypothetical protein